MNASIRALYPCALAEGEGVGTAYEYYVKRRILRPALASTPKRGAVLVAGLPEKYGTSLDFILAAAERRATVLVVDDRSAALDRAQAAFARIGAGKTAVEYRKVEDMANLASLPRHDLVLSCEVLQRFSADHQRAYAAGLRACAPRGAIFVPNGENGSHTRISGLTGVTLRELAAVMGPGVDLGFVDMPPFPPGITRSAEQRKRASSGLIEGVAMWGLQAYAHAEPLVPAAVGRRIAHIAYARWGRGTP